jgi:hypothetical protein
MKTKVNSLIFKKIVVFIAAVFLFSSCDNNDEPFTPVNIEFEVIGSGKLTGAGSEEILPGNYVLNNQNDWILLLNKMNSLNPETTNSFSTTTINFQTHIIIAVLDEIRPNLNWDININNITENSENIIVNVIVTNDGSSIQNVIRQPFKIVRIPITNKPIVFE